MDALAGNGTMNLPLLRGGVRFVYRALLRPRSGDEDLKRREFILNVLLLGSIVMLLALDASVLYYALRLGPAYRGISFAAFSVIPLFFIGLLALSRRGFVATASYLFVAAYLASNAYASYRWGVTLHAAVLAYALVITVASILVSTRFAFLVTGAIALYLLPLWHLQFAGRLPTQEQVPNGTDATVYVALYAVLAVVAWLSNREIEKSLTRARRSEAALKEERDFLDIKVEERTEELRHAQLEQIDQLYRFAEFGRLASGLFHDLVNMLNAVSLRVGHLSEDAPGKDGTAASLASAHGMHRQIESFMQAVQKQLSNQDVQELFSLPDGISQAVQLLAYKSHKEGVRIVVDPPAGDDLACFGNPFKFHQVVVNLVLNAIESYEGVAREYAPSGEAARPRTVTVSLAADRERFVLSVADHGAGIAEDLHQRVLEPLFTTKAKGIGIGLATTKRVVEKDFGGTLRLVSAPGLGTTFTVSFPRRNPPAGAP